MSSAHQTVTLLATVTWARVSRQERIQEAQLSLTNRVMLVCKVVEVWQDFLASAGCLVPRPQELEMAAAAAVAGSP